MRSQHQRKEASIADQAARWLCELEDAAVTPRARAECVAWLKESPLHVREFLHMAAIWRGLDDIDSQRRLSVEQLLAAASAKVVPLQDHIASSLSETALPIRSPSLLRSPRRYRQWALGAAALVVVATALSWWAVLFFAGKQTYATAVGEQRALRLADGSVVNLNTRSRIEVRFDEHTRDIRLLEGEALFTVARDRQRPFRVHAADTVIQAVGTQFNVYRRSDATTVSVLEGVVQVSVPERAARVPVPQDAAPASSAETESAIQPKLSPEQPLPQARLAAGEEAHIVTGGGIEKRSTLDIDQAVAWRERKLVFRADTLDEVATEVNRYNDMLQIRVEGAARNRRIIGVFAADDPESLVQFLARDDSLVVERGRGRIVIRAR